jgi:hypothetical protein
MSITFSIEGRRHDCKEPWECGECLLFNVNVSNTNAYAILEWLGLNPDPWGQANNCDPTDFAARCRRRLWPEAFNEDQGVQPTADGRPIDTSSDESMEKSVEGARVIDCGRRPGYLKDRTAQLLVLADEAIRLGSKVVWG